MTDKTDREIMHQAVQTVIQAMQDDPEYAWGWHCNIAMAFVDAGGDRYTANQGAARFLEMFAKVQPAHELPAPEQKPVAVIKRNEAGQITMQTPDGNPFDMFKYIGAKLFTPPPQREWQRLTDEDIDVVTIKCFGVNADLDFHRHHARAIEAKLKEKNT